MASYWASLREVLGFLFSSCCFESLEKENILPWMKECWLTVELVLYPFGGYEKVDFKSIYSRKCDKRVWMPIQAIIPCTGWWTYLFCLFSDYAESIMWTSPPEAQAVILLTFSVSLNCGSCGFLCLWQGVNATGVNMSVFEAALKAGNPSINELDHPVASSYLRRPANFTLWQLYTVVILAVTHSLQK